MHESLLSPFFAAVEGASTLRWHGRVTKVVGNLIESEGPLSSLGDSCEVISSKGDVYPGEIVGFRDNAVLSMTLQPPKGIRFGDSVVGLAQPPSIAVGDEILGRVLDATGAPLDGITPARPRGSRPVDGSAPLPYARIPVREVMPCGIRAIDGFVTCGRGQRIGIFGGSGVGKSTLIGMLTRGSAADVTVLALIGERGREVREFVEESIGEEGMQRAVVIVSTSDQSPLLRLRAAMAATAVAEHFAAEGKHVLLVLDSLTRFGMAQREIGLAAGEPPTAKGYTPSVFTLLARLVERAGNFERGSITGFYTVLMEGDDLQDPLVDAVRSLLDGHIVLDRKLASDGHYPPIQILESLSRLASAVCSVQHLQASRKLRAWLASYVRSEDLIRIGAYQRGGDPVLDQAVSAMPEIRKLLIQGALERTSLEEIVSGMSAIANR
ncbi:type III secretion system ATPase, FliI/YscN [Candidatus Koribacter versatilis Ellin345]|uniref:Type III secretion system ATPase, FliI/YscN n=1 Tax=Koribacter versatilis (strain Ellin345) TaxID=204669 RepID=Q1IR49_KORVE|nr:FliI/YscN family ATPase [Candidatus Koribacter versatilis]ABF40651.1 type III secretion system ATPase, FliI/YscN [Candidatus Koribacter versatilis Ellin345]